jgi:hypothetical protein
VVSAGLPSITASYNGDAAHLPSMSAPFATRTWYLPDSVSATCADGTQSIACPTTPGLPGYGQDGSFTINNPSYTLSATGWSIVDEITGLTWAPLDSSGTARTYDQAVAYCANLGSTAYDGITNWRIPTAREALTIVDAGRKMSAVGPSTFFVYLQNGGIWTSDAFQAVPQLNWVLQLNWPIMSASSRAGSTWPSTTCVASGAAGGIQTTGGSFVVDIPASPGTRLDVGTGLTWQAATAVETGGKSTFTWLEAIAYCNSLNTAPALGGLSSWRLPSLKEIWTIVDTGGFNPAIDTSVFPDTVSGFYWTSSPLPTQPSRAYPVEFGSGTGSINAPAVDMTSLHSVRCVAKGAIPNQIIIVGPGG